MFVNAAMVTQSITLGVAASLVALARNPVVRISAAARARGSG